VKWVPSLDKGASKRLILMRHGEPVPEMNGRCCGNLDVNLSATGREQVRNRVTFLRGLAPEMIYTSGCKRAIDSAKAIANEISIGIKSVSALNEIDFGVFEGLSFDDIKMKYPKQYRRWMEHPTDIKFPCGESFAEMRTRVLGFLNQLARVQVPRNVLVISHAGVNRIILANALGLPWKQIFRIDQTYAGISIIDYFAGTAVVRLVNG
jgi:broad specificity phosphatase PhoE